MFKSEKARNRQKYPQIWKKQFICKGIYAFIMIAYCIVFLYIAIKQYLASLNFSLDYNTLDANFEKNPITSLRVSTDDCEDDEDQMEYFWPGTMVGCDCRTAPEASIYEVELNISKGQCSIEQTLSGCQIIFPVQYQGLGYFAFNNDGIPTKICIKRMLGVNFYDNAPDEDKCSDPSQTICFSDGLGNFGKFCIPSSEECPINAITLGSNDTNPNPTLYTEKLEISSQFAIYFSRTAQEMPISQILITEGDWIAPQNKTTIKTNEREDYMLLNGERVDFTFANDTKYKRLFTMGEREFFTMNGLQQLIDGLLPEYQTSNEYLYSAYFSSYFPWKVGNRYLLTNLKNSKLAYIQVPSSLLVLMIINSVGMFLMLLYFIIECFNLGSRTLPCFRSVHPYDIEIYIFFRRIFKYLPKVGQVLVIIWTFSIQFSLWYAYYNIGINSDSTNALIAADLTETELFLETNFLYFQVMFIIVIIIIIFLDLITKYCVRRSWKINPTQALLQSSQQKQPSDSNNAQQLQANNGNNPRRSSDPDMLNSGLNTGNDPLRNPNNGQEHLQQETHQMIASNKNNNVLNTNNQNQSHSFEEIQADPSNSQRFQQNNNNNNNFFEDQMSHNQNDQEKGSALKSDDQDQNGNLINHQ